MTDIDSDIVEDMKNTPLAEETDDSCVVQLIEIVPLDRTSHDECKPGFIPRVVEVKPEDLQDVKQEPADDYNTEDQRFTIQVRSASTCNTVCCRLMICSFVQYYTVVKKTRQLWQTITTTQFSRF